jgi:CHAT domain-containing protein
MLFQLIWKPLEKYLTGIHTVYYAPAGLLHRIAFQALREDSSHLLIDKYQLNQVLSTRSVVLPQQVTKPASACIWGNIRYGLQTEACIQ